MAAAELAVELKLFVDRVAREAANLDAAVVAIEVAEQVVLLANLDGRPVAKGVLARSVLVSARPLPLSC